MFDENSCIRSKNYNRPSSNKICFHCSKPGHMNHNFYKKQLDEERKTLREKNKNEIFELNCAVRPKDTKDRPVVSSLQNAKIFVS